MNPFIANERDFRQMVIRSADAFPDQLKAQPGLHVFAWGHEVKLFDAGAHGGDGAADILTVDEEGLVWLIEAKRSQSKEHGHFVWHNQLRRYQNGVPRMSWPMIFHYAESFLKCRELVRPWPEDVAKGATSFVEVLARWQEHIGRALVPASELNDRMAHALKNGHYGIMALSDGFSEEALRSGKAFTHPGPVAYTIAVPFADGLRFVVPWYRPSADAPSETPIERDMPSDFAAHLREINIDCRETSIQDSLCPGARQLWLDVLRPALVGLGWDPGKARHKPKSFEIAFPVGSRRVTFLSVGWTGDDSRGVARENKLAGSAALRVDVEFKQIAKAPFFDMDFFNRYCARFHAHGWKGRARKGMETWGTRRVEMPEFRAGGGVMQFRTDEGRKGFTGRSGERESLHGFIATLSEMLKDARRRSTSAGDPW